MEKWPYEFPYLDGRYYVGDGRSKTLLVLTLALKDLPEMWMGDFRYLELATDAWPDKRVRWHVVDGKFKSYYG